MDTSVGDAKRFPYQTLRERCLIMEGMIIKMYEGYKEDQDHIHRLERSCREYESKSDIPMG